MRPLRERASGPTHRNRFSLVLQLSKNTSGQHEWELTASPTGTETWQRSPGPSPTSFADKVLNNSRSVTPLSPSRSSMNVPRDTESIPPTLNELDDGEKSRLVRKARKLSQIFGEVPVFECPHADTHDHDPTGFIALSRTTSVSRVEVDSRPRRYREASRGSTPTSQPGLNNIGKASTEPGPITEDDSIPFEDLPNSSYALCDNLDNRRITPSKPRTPEQLRRARVSKLSRHLGENIPPECVTSISPTTLPCSTRTHRRLSLDLGCFKYPAQLSPLGQFPSPDADGARLNRSWSSRLKKRGPYWVSEPDRGRLAGKHVVEIAGTPHLSDRQRAISVKRARKIEQLLGEQPPLELIMPPAENVEPAAEAALEGRSLSTLVSVASESTLTLSQRSLAFPRTRSDSASTVSTDSEFPLGERAGEVIQNHEPDFDNSDFVAAVPNIGNANLPARPQNPTRLFSSFHNRQRRAAKLSRFFGAGWQNFSESLMEFDPPLPPPLAPPVPSRPRSTVDIQIRTPSRFWGSSDDSHLRDAELVDVLDQLRNLRAA